MDHADRVAQLEADKKQTEFLRKLAAEREARAAKSKSDTQPVQSASAAAPGPTPRPTPQGNHWAAVAGRQAARQSLVVAHRTVQLAHSAGCVLLALGLLTVLLWSALIGVCVILSAVALARSGALWLHGVLPTMLVEGAPPKPFELAVNNGIFSASGVFDPNAWAVERQVALESLAYVCTYGKKNCLTTQMYTGDLSLGKIWRLVYGKLSEGVVRC
mmetsp:Transcript_17125/g.28680  ORF Transcript_17125/g.28680 Transcript_17125/m.28680 type:complete len:216 (+) Transcript_17125:21-668(+)